MATVTQKKVEYRRLNNESIAQICLQDIVSDSSPYCLRFSLDDSLLFKSVKKMGIITPVLVCQRAQGAYYLVSGFKRVKAARLCRLKKVPAYVIKEKKVDDLSLFIKALHANLHSRYSALDKSIVIHRAGQTFSLRDEQIRTTILPLLGLAPAQKHITMHRAFLDLCDPFEKMLNEGLLNERAASYIALFSQKDQTTLYKKIISKCHLSSSDMRICVEALYETLRREHKSLGDIVSAKDIMSITNGDFSLHEKGQRIKELLLAERYPIYKQMCSALESIKTEAQLPKMVQLIRPPHMEKSSYDILLHLSSEKDIEKAIAVLETNKAVLSQLFHIEKQITF